MPQKTWVVGEEVLAADFNSYVQNQVVPQFPNTAGRDTWTSPPDGAMCVTTDLKAVWLRAGGVWVMVLNGSPAWFRVIGGGAGQSCAQGAATAITWATGTQTDPFSIVDSNGLFTCPPAWAGRWRIDYSLGLTGSAGTMRQAWLSGSVVGRYASAAAAPTPSPVNLTGSADIVFPASGTIQMNVFHDGTAAITAANSALTDYFQGRWVGP